MICLGLYLPLHNVDYDFPTVTLAISNSARKVVAFSPRYQVSEEGRINQPSIGDEPTLRRRPEQDARSRRLEWLKSHREEYGGQYVALDGDRLIAVAPNYRIAREKALAAGKPSAFVTYLPKPDEVAQMGGGE
jgi:hypothetical protein